MPKIVGVVTSCNDIPNKQKLKVVEIDIGTEQILSIVTNAPNIRVGTRTVIATVGTEVNIDGEEITVSKQKVGGFTSEGMVCDSNMCGWSGGAKGIAVQVPSSYSLGSDAPLSKPRMDGSATEQDVEVSAKELKAREKAAKKALAAEKKAARLAKKADAANDTNPNSIEESVTEN